MNSESLLYWSFPCGNWFQTRVRVSIYFPLIVLVICFQLHDFRLGLIFSGILFLSVLCHEFGHVVAARLTGGGGDEILIWPLGGLAFVRPAGTFKSRFLTPAAGPLVNLVLCGITLLPVLNPQYRAEALNPLVLPAVKLSSQLFQDLLVLTFAANWILLLVNLIPVFPLDGGRMLQTCLTARWDRETGTEIYIRIGFLCAFLVMLGGLIAQSPWLVFIGAVVLVLNMQESQQLRAADRYDESFMGYDFSQGYTSLEQSGQTRSEQRAGFLKRWREKRRAEKEQRTQQQDEEAVQQLDAILDKVHTKGLESLTEAERRQLNRASARYRDKGKQSE